LDEFYEFIFFTKGIVDIGFELNKKKFFAIRQFYDINLGGMGCTYDHESEFIYRTSVPCSGYSIRKHWWK